MLTGVVCGHIHHAAIGDIGGIIYVNTGDFDGRLEILRWQMTAEEQRLAALADNEGTQTAARAAGRRWVSKGEGVSIAARHILRDGLSGLLRMKAKQALRENSIAPSSFMIFS